MSVNLNEAYGPAVPLVMSVAEAKCPYRKGLPTMPASIAALPVDERGYPCPWFIAWQDGKPEFRCIGPGKFVTAVQRDLCWICGERLSSVKTFVLGPMCTVSLTSAEPPSHPECARFAALACPFLTIPSAQYRDACLPEDAHEAGGLPLKRNPGVVALWHATDYKVWNPGNGFLVTVGEPGVVDWFREGRRATRSEVEASVNSGLPKLMELAGTNPEEVRALNIALEKSRQWWPA